MSIQPATTKPDVLVEILSKKRLNQLIYTKFMNTLYEFDISEKKYQNKLKKLSKQVAKDVIKKNKQKKAEEQSTTLSIDTAHGSFSDNGTM
jgi:predicted kinase